MNWYDESIIMLIQRAIARPPLRRPCDALLGGLNIP
jgi:hypothetical protein